MRDYLVVFGTGSKKFFVIESDMWIPSIEKEVYRFGNKSDAWKMADRLNEIKRKYQDERY